MKAIRDRDKLAGFIVGIALLLLPASAFSGKGVSTRCVGDKILCWATHPEQRDSDFHLALVEVIDVPEESYSVSVKPGNAGSVSYDGGKTPSGLMRIRKGKVRLKMVECPDGKLPPTLTVAFETAKYIPTPETPWTDNRVVPGARLFGFFGGNKKRGRDLQLDGFYGDPLEYLTDPKFGEKLQSFFKTKLASDAAIAARRNELEPARLKSQGARRANTKTGLPGSANP